MHFTAYVTGRIKSKNKMDAMQYSTVLYSLDRFKVICHYQCLKTV